MTNQTPSFFKVLAGCFSKKLRIPESFVNEFGEDLYGKVVLMSSTGNPAIVSVERGSRRCFFEAGWPSFVKDHGLEEGDFLVFNFTGRKTVDVVMYDPTGCVKRNGEVQTSSKPCPGSARSRKRERSPTKPRKEQSWSETAKVAKWRRRRVETSRTCRKSGRNLETEKSPKTRKGSTLKPREAPPIKTESEEEDGYSSGNAPPQGQAGCFKVVYKKYMAYCVCIPVRFSKTTKLSLKKTARLQDPSGKVWPVSVISGGTGIQKRFGCGWPAFAVANGVGPGDLIDFTYKPELDLVQVKIQRTKSSSAGKTDSDGRKRLWKRADAVNPQRSPSSGRNRETEYFPKPRKGLKGKRGAPMEAESGNGLAVSFQVVYKKYNVQCNYVCIPVRFSETTKLSMKKTARLQDPSGKVWEISVIAGGKGIHKRFCGGWKALAAANGLDIGDRIHFSYKPESGLIHVKFLRQKNTACKDSGVGMRPWKRSDYSRAK